MKSISSSFVMGIILTTMVNLLAQPVAETANWKTDALSGVAYGNDIFVAVGPGGLILTSVDGKVWLSRNSGVAASLHAVAFGNSQFVAVGDGGTILTSPSGEEWTNRPSRSAAYLNG